MYQYNVTCLQARRRTSECIDHALFFPLLVCAVWRQTFLSVWKTIRPINLYKREHVFLHVLFTNFNCLVWDKIRIAIKDIKNVVNILPNIELPYLAFSGGFIKVYIHICIVYIYYIYLYIVYIVCWCFHLIVVRRFEYASDPESYSSGSVATGRASLAGPVKG